MAPLPSFYDCGTTPYPALPATVQAMTASAQGTALQRMSTPRPRRDIADRPGLGKKLALSLTNCFPTAYGVPSFELYNTLTWYHAFAAPVFQAFNEKPIEAYRAYGIRWIVLVSGQPSDTRFVEGLGEPKSVDGYDVWEVPDTAPFAFAAARPTEALPVALTSEGVVVNAAPPGSPSVPEGGEIVINVLGWPRFNVYADGRKVSWKLDAWKRIAATVPVGTQRVEARYEPPWRVGAGIALGLLVCAGGVAAVVGWVERRVARRSVARVVSPPAEWTREPALTAAGKAGVGVDGVD